MGFKLPLHIARRRSYFFDSGGQFFPAYAEFFAPISNLIIFFEVDPIPVWPSCVSFIVRHVSLRSLRVWTPFRISLNGDLGSPIWGVHGQSLAADSPRRNLKIAYNLIRQPITPCSSIASSSVSNRPPRRWLINCPGPSPFATKKRQHDACAGALENVH